MSDEILEVNGRTLENATHNEVIQYIHQVIISIYYVIFKFGVAHYISRFVTRK